MKGKEREREMGEYQHLLGSSRPRTTGCSHWSSHVQIFVDFSRSEGKQGGERKQGLRAVRVLLSECVCTWDGRERMDVGVCVRVCRCGTLVLLCVQACVCVGVCVCVCVYIGHRSGRGVLASAPLFFLSLLFFHLCCSSHIESKESIFDCNSYLRLRFTPSICLQPI